MTKVETPISPPSVYEFIMTLSQNIHYIYFLINICTTIIIIASDNDIQPP